MCSHLFYFSTALKHGTSPPHPQRLVLHNQYTSPSTSVPLKLTNIKKMRGEGEREGLSTPQARKFLVGSWDRRSVVGLQRDLGCCTGRHR